MSSNRYVLVDLDGLNRDVREYMQTRKNEFSTEELAEQWPLDPVKLTRFLSVSDGMRSLLGGICNGLMDEDVEAFRAAGWDLQAKGRLRDLLYRLLTGDEDGEANMMILLGAELTESMLKYVRKYLEAGWRVQIYTFRSKGRKEVERLRSESPDMFHGVFLDRFVNFLLKDGENLELLAPQTTAKVTSSAETARCNGRYVFMNADAITQIYGKKFYKKVPGATKTGDIRLNFGALTTLACGGDKTDVKRQVAICGAANEYAMKQLQRRGWTMDKQKAAGTVMGSLLQKLEELASSASSGALKTLVLLIGSEAQSLQDREKWDRVIIALLKKNWCIEVLFWHRSVSRKFGSARKAYPNQITLVTLANDLLYLSEKARAAKKLSNITASASAAAPQRPGSSSVSTTEKTTEDEKDKEEEISYKQSI
ncbi:hypothetical protein P3T76_002256 [Phytophthora citrophthora]|uniref:Uncharacterized protein n=1 Tax=Phytophthora citrophthora TaxID=4793 RepID=A0AAD9LU25_9STRA|nr:hypothetical protein P3T76_002256 [Phytophthora citrophthora]